MGIERSEADEGSTPTLSVVVVTYNEGAHIGSCLSSVFECCAPFPDVEVLVVDSNSTDDTVERALAFPVRVYRITDDEYCTPGAGRYVGTQYARGDHLLFVDGDMTLTTGWLSGAVDRLEADDAVAGVDGQLNESGTAETVERDCLRGVVLYERAALDAVGGFDPYLQALEDIELGYRLTSAGHGLLRLPTVVAHHPSGSGPNERLRRWHNGYYFGWGEAFRKSLASPPVFRQLLYRSRLYVAGLCWLALGGLSLLGGVLAVVAWLAASALLFVGLAAVMGAADATSKLVGFPFVYAGTVIGFLGAHPDPGEFPMSTVEQVGPLPDTQRRVRTEGR